MAKKKPPGPVMVAMWRAEALHFTSAANIGARWGYAPIDVARALYPEYVAAKKDQVSR